MNYTKVFFPQNKTKTTINVYKIKLKNKIISIDLKIISLTLKLNVIKISETMIKTVTKI